MQIRENQVCNFANKQQCGKQVQLVELFPSITHPHLSYRDEEMIFQVIMLI